MRTDVRILLVGDEGVGKSTIIVSLLREEYVDKVEHVVGEVTIPPHVTPEKVTTHIIDSSALPEDREKLDREIRRANVVCVVYSAVDAETFERVTTHWLPYIRKLGANVPIVLVGNKIDLRGNAPQATALDEEIMPIMNDWKEVETCVECSAKTVFNISEVFYFAQKAVLHPTPPLYDPTERNLKPKCTQALQRIFKLCDFDKDGILNDDELNEFQRTCFSTPLQQQELEGVKRVVRENMANGVVDDGITEMGFVFLNVLFIQRGRLETTWTVLRTFGYDDDLELREDFLHPPLSLHSDQSCELSRAGYQFFTDIFGTFDKDGDLALSPLELAHLFETAPTPPPGWDNLAETTVTNENGWITLQGFLAQWRAHTLAFPRFPPASMTTALDYRTTLAYLAYLGMSGDTVSAIARTKRRKEERKINRNQRGVYVCYVVGAVGCGKTSILRRHIRRPIDDAHVHTKSPASAVNTVDVDGLEKYLVLQDLTTEHDREVLQDKELLGRADCVCFVYDSSDPNSFAYVAGLMAACDLDRTPCLFVATKSDMAKVPQRFDFQPDEYCRRLKLGPPMNVSLKEAVTADIYTHIARACAEPAAHFPNTEAKATSPSLLRTVALYTATVALLAGAGYLGYRFVYLPWRDGTLGDWLGTTTSDNSSDRRAIAPATAFPSLRTAVPSVIEVAGGVGGGSSRGPFLRTAAVGLATLLA